MRISLLESARLVAAKELVSYLRDRQTVLYTVVLPLVMYPLMFWVMIQGYTILRGRDEGTAVTLEVAGVGFPFERELEALALPASEELAPGTILCEPLPLQLSPEKCAARVRETQSVHALLLLEGSGARLFFDSTDSASKLVADRAKERLANLAEELRTERVEAARVDPDALYPFRIERVDLADERALAAYLFSFILPMTFVIMSVMGALYPAIESTAGEKERGTAETTMLLPGSRLGVQLGKIAAVTVSALVATVLNLLGLVLAAEPLLASLGEGAKSESFQVPWGALLVALPLCGTFLFTVSAMLLALASFTKTFKQGQASLGPVQMLFIVPAVFAIMPTVQLTPALALVPVVQTVLGFKTILTGIGSSAGVPWMELTLVFLSQALYAALAVWICVRMSTREALALGSGSTRAALRLWRQSGSPR